MTAPLVERLAALKPDSRPLKAEHKAPCPAHEDRVESLTWTVSDAGNVLVRCHAGCSTEAIVRALGAEMKHLFEPSGERSRPAPGAYREKERKPYRRRPDLVEYEAGDYLHVRTPEKAVFWVEKLTQLCGFAAGDNVVDMPLYPPDIELDPERPTFVNEGEKATDACRAAGLQAVGSVTGASACPGSAVLERLRDQDVILVPDNDDAGQAHMAKVAARLRSVARRLRVYRHPAGTPEHQDMADILFPGLDHRQLHQLPVGDMRDHRDTLSLVHARLEELPGAVTLAQYLDSLSAYFRRYVVFASEHEPVALALWTAHTHMLEGADVSPLLALTSAEMRSGKTLVLDLLEFVVANPERMVTPSPAATYTAISQRPRPTLMVDESDAIFTRKRKGDADTEGLRAVFNAGNRRGVTVARVEMQGKKRVLERLDVFGAKVLAGIGQLPDTITDRAIVIRMRRKSKADHVARFRYRRAEAEAAAIARPDWDAIDVETEVADIPHDISDRAQDSWEPLLALADAAGGTWPANARRAASVLSAEDAERVSEGIQLLGDIRDIFDAVPLVPDVPGVTGREGMSPSFASTSSLLQHLYRIGDGRWDDYYGTQLSARRLAQLLDPYGISPRQERVGEDKEPTRGYARRDFEDAWERYLTRPDTSGTSGTSGTAEGTATATAATGFAQATAEGTAIYEVGDLTGVAASIFGEFNEASK